MTIWISLRSFLAQPVRSAVLACGFGAGIACMAGLLGVGEVILEQSRSPFLRGGGELAIYGLAGDVTSARYVTARLFASPPFDGRVAAVSPSRSATLYLVQPEREPLSVRARGGVPSLERALGDPEIAEIEHWQDSPADRRWVEPDPGDVLRAMDRFHPIPDVPALADSWAEWLYFNGRSERTRFYLTFLVGPHAASGKRLAGVRLQLERDGEMKSFVAGGEIDEERLLAEAPDLEIAGNRVELDGRVYRISLALQRLESFREGRAPDLEGTLTLDASAAGGLPPIEVGGAGGWVSGYTVPVLSGPLAGRLELDGESIPLDGATGYHDHNWGFWEGVTWQWGQVADGDLSLLYGRIRPPLATADLSRTPAFLVVLGPDGPLGFSTQVAIDETNDPATGRPSEIVVSATGHAMELTMKLAVTGTTRNRLGGWFGGSREQEELLQMQARYRVSGRVAGRRIEFEAEGAAETFRGAPSREAGEPSSRAGR
jgi:hypothetical protein